MKFTLQWLGGLFILLSTSSCQAIQDARRDRWDKIRLAAFKSGVCPLHHVRLQGTAVYCWSHSETEPSDPRPADPFFMREDKYPMRLSVTKGSRLREIFTTDAFTPSARSVSSYSTLTCDIFHLTNRSSQPIT